MEHKYNPPPQVIVVIVRLCVLHPMKNEPMSSRHFFQTENSTWAVVQKLFDSFYPPPQPNESNQPRVVTSNLLSGLKWCVVKTTFVWSLGFYTLRKAKLRVMNEVFFSFGEEADKSNGFLKKTDQRGGGFVQMISDLIPTKSNVWGIKSWSWLNCWSMLES